MFVKELYDIKEQKGVLHIADHSTFTKINYFDKSKQMFVEYENASCEVGK